MQTFRVLTKVVKPEEEDVYEGKPVEKNTTRQIEIDYDVVVVIHVEYEEETKSFQVSGGKLAELLNK